jgi:3-vinyl bacteriochlorophyllide hydratase
MFTSGVLARIVDQLDACPWGSAAGRHAGQPEREARRPLYTPEERVRRDATPWTLVQGILAPLQFLVFLVSLTLVLRTLLTGEGYEAANASVVFKTFVLYTIMITGAIWEKVVFGRYLFAPAFYWEDMFSMLVIALHTAYLATIIWTVGDARFQMWLALAAYAAYVVNAMQFVMKLRAARLDEQRKRQWHSGHHGALGFSK